MAKPKQDAIHKTITDQTGDDPDIGETFSYEINEKLIRDIIPVGMGADGYALIIASGPATDGLMQGVIILDSLTQNADTLLQRNAQGKLELTSFAKNEIKNTEGSSYAWRVLIKNWSANPVADGPGKVEDYFKTGRVKPRNEPLGLVKRNSPKKPLKKKSKKKSSKMTNGEAQSDRSKNGKKFQMYIDKKVVLPALKGTNFDYINEANAGGDFADRAEDYDSHYYEVQRNGHENFFGEVNDTDGGVVNKFTPQIPLINISSKVLIKEHGSNLIKDAKNNAELGIYTFIFLSKAESFGWYKGKTDRPKPRKHLRMIMNLKEQLGKEGKAHLVEVFIDDDTGLDERTFTECGICYLSEATGIIEATLERYENVLTEIVAPEQGEGLEDNACRIIQELDYIYAERMQREDEYFDGYPGGDSNWIPPETPITFQQALALMDAYRDRTIRF